MNEQTEVLPFDSLAKLNQDGGITKLVLGPLIVIAGAIVLIVVVRFIQKTKERAAMESALKE